MACGMLIANFLLTITTAFGTYTQHQDKNAFSDQFGVKGAHHYEHCEHERTLDECKSLCDMDCECHCFVVYMGSDTTYDGNTTKPCFRRHSCDPSTMESDPSFDVYIKDDNSSSNCSLFTDFGFEKRCVGGSGAKTATNVGTLEECKHICELLSFECKGIEYLSSCTDTTQDTCVIYTAGEITDGQGTAPVKPGDVNLETYHCLKYTGPVGAYSGVLFVPMHFTINGIDSGALMQNSNALNTVSNKIKDALANQSSFINASLVLVQFQQTGAANLTADIEVELQAAADFHDVRQALRDNLNALETAITNELTTLNSTLNLGSGPFSLTEVEFNLTNAVFETTTETSTTVTETINGTEETTTTTDQISVSGAYRIGMIGTLLMWLAVSCYPQA